MNIPYENIDNDYRNITLRYSIKFYLIYIIIYPIYFLFIISYCKSLTISLDWNYSIFLIMIMISPIIAVIVDKTLKNITVTTCNENEHKAYDSPLPGYSFVVWIFVGLLIMLLFSSPNIPLINYFVPYVYIYSVIDYSIKIKKARSVNLTKWLWPEIIFIAYAISLPLILQSKYGVQYYKVSTKISFATDNKLIYKSIEHYINNRNDIDENNCNDNDNIISLSNDYNHINILVINCIDETNKKSQEQYMKYVEDVKRRIRNIGRDNGVMFIGITESDNIVLSKNKSLDNGKLIFMPTAISGLLFLLIAYRNIYGMALKYYENQMRNEN